MNKHILIQGLAGILGVIAGAATTYYSHDSQLGASIGGLAYAGALGLGYIDPTTRPETATVTQDDLHAAIRAIQDAHAHNIGALGNDIIPLLQSIQEVIGSLKPAAPSPGSAQTGTVGPAPQEASGSVPA